jgi:prevent-host-death family protein
MKVIPAADLKADLNTYLEQCKTEGPIVITENGKAVAVLLAPRDEEDLERLLLARSPRFQALLERSRESIQAQKGLSRDAFWRAVEECDREKNESPPG